jgi:hypothetical protein
MRATLHDVFGALPHALTIWLALVALVAAGFLCTAVPAARQRWRAARSRAADARLRRVHLAAQAAEHGRAAEEVAVAAARAAVTAQRRQDEWEAVRRAREAAWRAFSAADADARRTARAAAFALPEEPVGQPELRARERYLHRTATEAYRRGELSVADLGEILSHRNGWNPHRHPADQEAALRRVARDRLLAVYRSVAAVEETARHDAELAAASARSLQIESTALLAQARHARVVLEADQGRQPVPVGARSVLVPGH